MYFFGADGLDGILGKVSQDVTIADNVLMMTPFAADSADPKVQAFVKAYEEAYGAPPDQFAADAYDAVYTVKAAVEAANGSTSGADLAAVMTSLTVEGVTGTMTWNADGNTNKAASAILYKNTMVDGIAKMLNFAHGDVIMVGAYSGIVAVAQLGLSPWVTVIVSIVVCAVLGVVIEFCAYKPLRQAAPLSVLITAIGVSYLLQNAALLLFGSQQMAYPTLVKLGSFSVGGVQVDGITVLTLAVTAVLMAALTLFIDKTKLGKAMRAVSEDKDAATLMGISVDRTITLTFAIGSALAAFASMFYGMTYVYIKPTTGAMPGIKAFTAAVFGGIGSIPGAMLGGILLGLIEQMSKTYISTLWADAIVFAVLVVVLVVKPTGLLGKPMQEKV